MHEWKTQQISQLGLLYDAGYNLIPCHGKIPCVPWQRWQTERIPAERYKQWAGGVFEKSDGSTWELGSSNINWALLTGSKPYSPAPALVVVDCDDQPAIELARSRCLETLARQATPKSGLHLVYRRPAVEYLGQCLGWQGHKLDIKADGNYIMAPGSIKDDRRYQCSQPWTLDLLQSLPAYDPVWFPVPTRRKTKVNFSDHGDLIHSSLIPLELRRQYAANYLENCPGSEQGRGADHYCFALAMTLVWGYLLPGEHAHDLLYEWGQKETNVDSVGGWYPWSSKEITHKIDNALHTEYQKQIGDRLHPDAYVEKMFQELYG